ncbi:MAG: SDR family oxidoreductase [Mesorhizobium sp.]|nr:MAG: SDR family oxidoreductase [Mesorhizobium sp.]
MEKQRLAARSAIVTGAARGIGQAIARRLAMEGANVVVADIDIKEAEEVAASLRASGFGARACEVDIAETSALEKFVRVVTDDVGSCDILVNNAAVLDASKTSELTIERYRDVMRVNLDGALGLTLKLLPLLKQSSCARVVNVASIMGIRGSRDSIPYSTAKGGLINLTRCLACDLADQGILVNAIAPGFVDTRMALLPDGSGHEHETDWFQAVYIKHGRIPMRRAGTATDIANAAYFLCSDDASYVTGQVLLVDGGASATF